MKRLLSFIVLISCSAFANTFQYEERPYNFQLKIDHSGLSYSSEGYKHAVLMSDCNRSLLNELNSEMISLCSKNSGKGPIINIDSKKVNVKRQSFAHKSFQSMDVRMRQFALEENKKCVR